MSSEPRTRFFFDLTPERVLTAAEAAGFTVTGRCLPLNSYENRVYEVELDTEPAERRVVKFYRPGRWNEAQILAEHGFLADLAEAEIPVVAPVRFTDGTTLRRQEETGLYHAVWPKVGGRVPDELDDDQLRWIGRLLARIHGVGAAREAPARLRLTPETYGLSNLAFLEGNGWIPADLSARFASALREICAAGAKRFERVPLQRIHGDCHLGNLLWGTKGPFFLDFDDMVTGPAVQDLWLIAGGPDEEGARRLSILLEGYEEMRAFPRSTLDLIEVLRALRYVHFAAWFARRWEDPAFPRAFPHFNTPKYWHDLTRDLEEQAVRIRS